MALLTTIVSGAWANQTTLISDVTLPDIPTGTLDLSSQTDYTANANGWIVESSPKGNIDSKNWHSKMATDGGKTSWTVPTGCTAPFNGSTDDSNSRYTVRSGARTHAIRFTGAETASFLVSRNSDTRKALVSLFSYSGTTQTLIETKSMSTGSIGELLFENLSTSTTYIAYIYGSDASNNSDWYEFALKAPVTTFIVTYKAGAGTGDDVVDNNAAAVSDCPSSFTAPSGKAFAGWNTQSDGSGTSYAVGTAVTSNLTLYAQWAASRTVTYSLGSGTGTVPTQSDVAEGSTFTVADAPSDLVPPAGKEFKCWNDGTNDYNEGATYTVGTSNITLTAVYQDRTYQGLTPEGTLDLADGTNFVSVWITTAGKLTKNYYYDAANGIAVMSSYAVYQSKNSQKINWETYDSGNSSTQTWNATGPFKGSSYYFESEDRSTSVRETERNHYYRVKSITSVSALFGGKAGITVYEVNNGVVDADPVYTNEIIEAGTATINSLDATKEYIIKVYGKNGSSNVLFHEIAFTFPAVANVTLSPAKEYTTLTSAYNLDFTDVDGLKAYIVEDNDASDGVITMTQVNKVPAGTGLVVKKTGSAASFDVPVFDGTGADDVSGNKMEGSATATTHIAANGGYILSDGEFHPALEGDLPSGKAYLKITVTSNAPVMSFGDATAIDEVRSKMEDVRGDFYNLNGQRVAQPTKGLYIVNGRKVIMK